MDNHNLKKLFLFIGVIFVQILVILGMIGYKSLILASGTTVLLPLEPVDPRDFFRGDYMVVNYEINRLDSSLFNDKTDNLYNKSVYVYLKKGVDNNHYPTRVSLTRPASGLFIKGNIKYSNIEKLQVEYGIESYFFPEGRGASFSNIRDNDIVGEVVIDKKGNSILKHILVNGEIWPSESNTQNVNNTVTPNRLTPQQQARDAKRISDVRQLQLALELFHDNNGKYPADFKDLIDQLAPKYIPAIPVDPLDKTIGCANNNYDPDSEGNNYQAGSFGYKYYSLNSDNYALQVCLENINHDILNSDSDITNSPIFDVSM